MSRSWKASRGVMAKSFATGGEVAGRNKSSGTMDRRWTDWKTSGLEKRMARHLMWVVAGVLSAAAANAMAEETVWLSTLNLAGIEQSWGEPHADKSVEKNPLRIGGKTFEHGVGTHAESTWAIDLKKSATRFQASVGVDDE